MKKNILGLLIFLNSICFADQWDLSLATGGRNLPRGASINVSGGYGHLLWGEKKDQEFLYGFVRPYLTLATSGLVNSYETGISIFPISILGFHFGRNESYRATTIHTIVCDFSICGGGLSRQFYKITGAVGYGSIFLTGQYGVSGIGVQSNLKSFADENSTLIGKAGGDDLLESDLALGYKIDETLVAGLYYGEKKMLGTSNSNQTWLLIGRKKFGDYQVGGGFGQYQSTTYISPGFTFALGVKWVPFPSIGLF